MTQHVEQVIIDRSSGMIIYRSGSIKHAEEVWRKKEGDKRLSWYEIPSSGVKHNART